MVGCGLNVGYTKTRQYSTKFTFELLFLFTLYFTHCFLQFATGCTRVNLIQQFITAFGVWYLARYSRFSSTTKTCHGYHDVGKENFLAFKFFFNISNS